MKLKHTTSAVETNNVTESNTSGIKISPSAFDQSFGVRDFGIGLTSEEVEGIYSGYFESTKQDSNDYTGALGSEPITNTSDSNKSSKDNL